MDLLILKLVITVVTLLPLQEARIDLLGHKQVSYGINYTMERIIHLNKQDAALATLGIGLVWELSPYGQFDVMDLIYDSIGIIDYNLDNELIK